MKNLNQIKLYNSLTNKEEIFTPLEEGKVSMYVCGPTVYNRPHIGNMRPIVVFDTLRRLFEYLGYEVTYVSNYTDIDDKIIDAAQKENISELELSSKYIKLFENVVKMIGSKLPTITPRVSEYIPQIINYISRLIEEGAAYKTSTGIYFDVSKVSDYGCLSNIDLSSLQVGARIDEDKEKHSPYDFALWKNTNVGIRWDSPFGVGRPGWHTECCVMIDSIFKNHYIDIHGGGYDLKFPHHENEIAQSQIINHNKIARFWMHNAFINIGTEKMSKSLGNVLYPDDLIDKYGGPSIRLLILSAHYRQPINFTADTISMSQRENLKIESLVKQAGLYLQLNNLNLDKYEEVDELHNFINALCDDLNTANALMEVYNLVKKINQILRAKEVDNKLFIDNFKSLLIMLDVLGLDITYKVLDEDEKELYSAYIKAKQDKDFIKSDEIRKILMEKKII